MSKQVVSVVEVWAIDRKGFTLLVKHGKGESAPWYVPQRQQEFGVSVLKAASDELRSEWGLLPLNAIVLGVYDRVDLSKQEHLLTTQVGVLVTDIETTVASVNDEMFEIVHAGKMMHIPFWEERVALKAWRDQLQPETQNGNLHKILRKLTKLRGL